MFGKVATNYKVVPLERPTTEPVLNDELRASIASLRSHPGFEYLTSRARAVKAYLQRQLETGRHENMRDVQYLQAGIYWAEFWEREAQAKSQPIKPPVDPTEFERQAFETARAGLEAVGVE